MKQFMTKKGKLITTQFGFLSGQHRRRGTVSVFGRLEWPTSPSAGESRCPLSRPLSQKLCPWLNKSLAGGEIESLRPGAGALFLLYGEKGPGRPARGATPAESSHPSSNAGETKCGWSPSGIYPSPQPPKKQSQLFIGSLHRYIKLLSASAWMTATEGGGKG